MSIFLTPLFQAKYCKISAEKTPENGLRSKWKNRFTAFDSIFSPFADQFQIDGLNSEWLWVKLNVWNNSYSNSEYIAT